VTKIFNLSEAKDQLSSLVDRAASGEKSCSVARWPGSSRPLRGPSSHERASGLSDTTLDA
jgi:hypothetical protein